MAENYSVALQKSHAQEKELNKLNQKLRQLYGKIEDLKAAPVIEKKPHLEEELSLLARQNQNLKDQLKKTESEAVKKAKESGRKIASVQNSLRAHIGKNIASRLKAANLDVFVDPNTGAVILRMDNSFLFKINSAELSEGLKSTLRKVIPLYVDELFKDSDVSNKISHINIIGHASPRHRQKYVDPLGNNIRAYNYNLDLSSDRARSIVKYIFGNQFDPFNFQPQFRQKVQAIGKSFSEPVLRKPSSVSSSKSDCGKYDCKLSRRVEISFTLKDNKEVWENK
ncbi:MAG: chemotaxis protein MotB [Bacteriovoracaceae bacterium]